MISEAAKKAISAQRSAVSPSTPPIAAALEKLPQILRSLLYTKPHAAGMWRAARQQGLSDEKLLALIGSMVDARGYRLCAGIPCFIIAGPRPQLWLAQKVPVGEATLTPELLVQRVREVFNISYPPSEQPVPQPTTNNSPPPPPPQIVQVAVNVIVPNPKNPRGQISPGSIASLAASIKSVGIQAPLLGRPHPTRIAHVELLAGHRRLAAAKLAKLSEVPMVVRGLTDAQAAEVATIEQIEREDWHPLEQARGFAWLRETGWDVESIASRMGRAPRWVAQRLSLNELTAAWQKRLLADPEQLPTGILERLARLSKPLQDELYDHYAKARKDEQHGRSWELDKWIRVDDFDEWINENFLHNLAGVPWKLDDATLYPKFGACIGCPHSSAANPLLWESDEDDPKKAKKATCLNVACFQEKTRRIATLKVVEVKAAHPGLMIMSDDPKRAAAIASDMPVIRSHDAAPAKQSDRGAVPVLDADTAKVKWVKPYSSVSASTKAAVKTARAAAPRETPLKEKQAALECRRQAHVVEAFQKKLRTLANGADFQIKAGSPPHPWLQCCALLAAFGTRDNLARSAAGSQYGSPGKLDGWPGFDKRLKAAAEKSLVAELYRSLFLVWVERLEYFEKSNVGKCFAEAQRMAELLKIDLAPYRAAAAADIPTPKSWGLPEATKPQNPERKRAGHRTPSGSERAAPAKGKKKLVDMTDEDFDGLAGDEEPHA